VNRCLFQRGVQYTRKQIFEALSIADPRGGNWYTGYARHGDDWFIFCNVGTPGRTGHDYPNRFEGDSLVWYGKSTSQLEQPAVQSLLKPRGNIFIFYRSDDRSPFTFAGTAHPVDSKDTTPVEITWAFSS
jgi:5-methylcytosine-specific restriction protein A